MSTDASVADEVVIEEAPVKAKKVPKPKPDKATKPESVAKAKAALAKASVPVSTPVPKTNKLLPKTSPQEKRAIDCLKMAGDATRIQLLRIADGERTVGDMCSELGVASQPAISHHLALLRHTGLVEASRDGKNNHYRLTELGQSVVDVFNSLVEMIE